MNDLTIRQHIECVKQMIRDLSPEQADAFKDNLLSMLLFEENEKNNEDSGTRFQSLTAEEKDLIRKLAKQAEELHKLLRDQQNEDQ
jgi:hypothetical protein